MLTVVYKGTQEVSRDVALTPLLKVLNIGIINFAKDFTKLP